MYKHSFGEGSVNLTSAEKYFLRRGEELICMSQGGDPWVFLCAGAFLDCLSRMICGKNLKREGYVRTIRTMMIPEYDNFTYLSGDRDLPLQMWHILRCGIIHDFSLFPDEGHNPKKGRERSIVLCHQKESQEKELPHLSAYSEGVIFDAAVFVAEDFVEDVMDAVLKIFREAKEDSGLRNNIECWLKKHPPIQAGFPKRGDSSPPSL